MEDGEIVERLLKGIDAGDFVEGDRLLPERRLAETMEISRARLRRALDHLKEEGRLFRHQGQEGLAMIQCLFLPLEGEKHLPKWVTRKKMP